MSPSSGSNDVLLYVVMKFWCTLPEDGDNAETRRSCLIERIHRLYNCAFVGVSRVVIYHNARNEQYTSSNVLFLPQFSQGIPPDLSRSMFHHCTSSNSSTGSNQLSGSWTSDELCLICSLPLTRPGARNIYSAHCLLVSSYYYYFNTRFVETDQYFLKPVYTNHWNTIKVPHILSYYNISEQEIFSSLDFKMLSPLNKHVFPPNFHVTTSGKLPKEFPLPILHRPCHKMTLSFFFSVAIPAFH